MFLGLAVWLVCGLVVDGCRGVALRMGLDVSVGGLCGLGFGVVLCFVVAIVVWVRLGVAAVLFGVLVLAVWGLFSLIFAGGWAINVVGVVD